jgi:glycosyltransferase involved in cell wall biosynthesis
MSKTADIFISLVIPTFNEADNVVLFYPQLTKMFQDHLWQYELLYIDDGSTDSSLEQIQTLARQDPHVRFESFSRNFGKEAATSSGIHAARGDAIIMIDADGQFPLELIPKFVEAWQGGAEVVVGIRKSNQSEGWIKRYGSRVFNWMLTPLAGGSTVPGATDFRLIDRQVADAFKSMTERNRITRGLIDWLGYRRAYITFKANARINGRAGYTYRKLVKLALHTFVSQSTRPLLFTGVLGVFVVAISFVLGIFMTTERYVLHDPLHLGISGTAILAVFLSFLVGIVLVCQGLLALYIESIHNETQNRPLFILRKK